MLAEWPPSIGCRTRSLDRMARSELRHSYLPFHPATPHGQAQLQSHINSSAVWGLALNSHPDECC